MCVRLRAWKCFVSVIGNIAVCISNLRGVIGVCMSLLHANEREQHVHVMRECVDCVEYICSANVVHVLR